MSSMLRNGESEMKYRCVVGHDVEGKPAMIAFDGTQKPYFACEKHTDCLLSTEDRLEAKLI